LVQFPRFVGLLLVLLVSGCSSKVDQVKFGALNRSAREIQSAVGVGVTLERYREHVSAYAAEVSLARDRASSATEKQFVGLHAAALDAYRDGLTLWQKKIDQRGDVVTTAGDPDLKRMADEYGFAGSVVGGAFTFSIDKAMQKEWMTASGKLYAADRLYRGE
jgi:hypothetical protein